MPFATRLLVAAALLVPALPAVAQTAPAAPPPRLISISGHGSVKAVPDLATVSVSVVAQGRTARAALAQNAAAASAVVEKLAGSGIARADLTTSGYSLQAIYGDVKAGSNRRPPLLGYTANTSVTAQVRRLDGLGQLLDEVVDAGATGIDSVAFSLSDPAARMDEARRAALADARHRADLYAAAAGTHVGRVQSITENGGGYAPPPPVMYEMKAADQARAAVPVEAGTQEVGADVSVTYAIED